jgi:hypothetical protein
MLNNLNKHNPVNCVLSGVEIAEKWLVKYGKIFLRTIYL